MTTVLEAARLANAVYSLAQVEGWTLDPHYRRSWEGLWLDGLQAGVYWRQGGDSQGVIAFRGTNMAIKTPYGSLQDLGADLALGTGMNTNYYAAAEDFARPFAGRPDVVVCGHSLGGAIAQVMAKRLGFHFVSFNAPGVAVWTSNTEDPSAPGWRGAITNTVRTAGMTVSALIDPWQAVADVRAFRRQVHGLNVCVDGDPISRMGIHYGPMLHIAAAPHLPSEGSGERGAVARHSMDLAVRSVEADTALRDRRVEQLN